MQSFGAQFGKADGLRLFLWQRIQAADARKTHLAPTRLNQGGREKVCFSGFNFSEEKLRKKFLIEDFIFSVETRNYLQKVLLPFRGH